MIKLKELISEDFKSHGKSHGFVGIVLHNGAVIGKYNEFNAMETDHSELGYNTLSGKWRYFIDYPKNLLFWNDEEPSEDERVAVENWLHKKGFQVRKQVTGYDEFSRQFNEIINEDRSSKSVSYGCIMANCSVKDAKLLNAIDKKLIPDKDLYKEGDEYGFESEKHCTLKYGLKKDISKEELATLFDGVYKFEITLTALSQFKNGKEEGYDVVKWDCKSDILTRLNKKISDTYECEDTYPDYKPHITVGYVKPDSFKKEKKNLNIKVTIDEIVYSPAEGEKIYLKLTDKKKEKINEGKHIDFLNTEIPRLETEWERHGI